MVYYAALAPMQAAAWQGPELVFLPAAHPLISGSGVFKQPEPTLIKRPALDLHATKPTFSSLYTGS